MPFGQRPEDISVITSEKYINVGSPDLPKSLWDI